VLTSPCHARYRPIPLDRYCRTPNHPYVAHHPTVTGSLEESLRSAFAKPAMRALPSFNTSDMGFMPDNGGAAAAAAAFGGMAGGWVGG
jgi:hypothetical protein